MSALFLQGNSRDVLKNLPADYFHCCVTSPPYFGLRAYDGGQEVWDSDDDGCEHEWVEVSKKDTWGVEGTGLNGRDPYKGGEARVDKIASACSKCGAWRGQLGAEPTPELYIQHLIEIMREVRRVLRPDGVFWLNIGDSWGANWRGGGVDSASAKQLSNVGTVDFMSKQVKHPTKPLDMVLIPEQLALAARADGWYVRSVLIWAKGVSLSDEYNGNPMPESVNGWRWERHKAKVGDNAGGYVLRKGSWRPTDSYEHILMLTKTSSYFCDREAVLEQGVYPAGEKRNGGDSHKSLGAGSRTTEGLHNKDWNGNGGRNLRSVLMIPTTGFKGAHFAVFPPKLVDVLVRSATSEKGCCPKCGSPWARMIDKGFTVHDGDTATEYADGTNANRLALLRQAARQRGSEYGQTSRDKLNERGPSAYHFATGQGLDYAGGHGNNIRPSSTIGWMPTCSCDAGKPEPCRVLDCFSGAGTTSLVCERLGLDSIGIDTSEEYIQLAEARIVEDEQKRIDGQIKQLRREAKLVAKSG